MNKTTRVVCLCILGAVGALCGISTISTIENQTSKITSNPLSKAYIVANVMMDDPIAIAVQDQYYVLEREELAEYNGEVAQFLNPLKIKSQSFLRLFCFYAKSAPQSPVARFCSAN